MDLILVPDTVLRYESEEDEEDDDGGRGREDEAEEVPDRPANTQRKEGEGINAISCTVVVFLMVSSLSGKENDGEPKKKRIVRNPQPKLDADRICGKRGVAQLQEIFKDFKPKGEIDSQAVLAVSKTLVLFRQRPRI